MDTFIEEYTMPLEICDSLINVYNDNKDKAEDGAIGADHRIDISIKESKEICINPNEQKYISPYFENLKKFIQSYVTKYHYKEAGQWGPFSILESTNIQFYPKGGGFKTLHFERMTHEDVDREFVFMTYLTDTKNAGTLFPRQNVITECIKGNTVIWPAGFTHPHKGIVSDKEEKMIITGWINYKKV